jgi:hypothetical protein
MSIGQKQHLKSLITDINRKKEEKLSNLETAKKQVKRDGE